MKHRLPSRSIFKSLLSNIRAMKIQLIYCILGFIATVIVGYCFRWLCDDSLIIFRSVLQFTHGHGPVYNVGDRVEVSTSTVWYYLIAIFSFVVKPDTVAIWGGVLLTALGSAVAISTTVKYSADSSKFYLPIGLVLLLSYHPFDEFITSGLETSLIFFSIALLYCFYCNFIFSGRYRYTLPFLLGTLYLVRPELFIVGAVFLCFSVFSKNLSGIQKKILFFILYLIPELGYTIFRAGYYGVLVPNTAIAKEFSSFNLKQGLSYINISLDAFHMQIGIILIFSIYIYIYCKRKQYFMTIVLPFLLASLLLTGYLVVIGGDYMIGRMLLPSIEVLAIPFLVVSIKEKLILYPLTFILIGSSFLICNNKVLPTLLPVNNNTDYDHVSFPHLLSKKNYTDLSYRYLVVDERKFYIALTCNAHPTKIENFVHPCKSKGNNQVAMFQDTDKLMYFNKNKKPIMYYTIIDQITPMVKQENRSLLFTSFMLGMTGFATDLDKNVLDGVGLTYTLASHLKGDDSMLKFIDKSDVYYNSINTTRHILVQRAGHRKMIPEFLILADKVDMNYASKFLDKRQVAAAMRARKTLDSSEQYSELIASEKDKLTVKRFIENIRYSYQNTKFRILINPDGDQIKLK